MNKIAFALLLGAVFAVGCGDKGGDAKGSSSAAAAASGTAKASGGGGEIGVAECDAYIKQWQDCYKDPTMKAAAEPAFKQVTEQWKTMAKDSAQKEALKTACKTMVDNFPKDACK